jgi:hypothetical protein
VFCGGDTSIKSGLSYNLSQLSSKQIEIELQQRGVDGDLLQHTSLDADGQGGADIACLIRTPDGQTDTVVLLDDGANLKIKRYSEVQSTQKDTGWNDYRYVNVLKRLMSTFPTSSSQQSSWLTRAKGLFLPAIESDPTNDQIKILREVNDIKDPRFLGSLMEIVGHDLKNGRVYTANVIEEAYNGVTSLIPYLRMEQLIKLKAHAEAHRLEALYFHEHKSDEVHKGRAERHMNRLESLTQEIDTEIKYRTRQEYPQVPASDPRYISTHYKSALSGLLEMPNRVAEGVVQLLWSGEDPKTITSQFVFGAIYAGWRGFLAVPGELLSIVSGGAFGYNGRDLGAEAGNTILAAIPSIKFAKGLRATETLGKGDFSRPNSIEVVDLTNKIEVKDLTQPTVETPLGPITLPGDTAFPTKPTPGSISAKGGLATYSEVAPDVWIKPFESSDFTVPEATWSPPPEVIASATEAIPKEPIGFPGIPGAAISDPKPRDADEMIVLPGADKNPEPIGDPKSTAETIGDISPAEELHISAVSPVENLEVAIRRMEKIRHPLTEEGKIFLEKARATLSNPNASTAEVQKALHQFPTIEEPHLEYFEDVMVGIPLEEKGRIIASLNVIQVTKGCSHQCIHCAVSADPKVQIMPYITALKIAQIIKRDLPIIREKIEREFKATGAEIIGELRAGIVNSEKIARHLLTFNGYGLAFSIVPGNPYYQHFFRKFWALVYFEPRNLDGPEIVTERYRHLAWQLSRQNSMERKVELLKREIEELIMNQTDHVLLNGNDKNLPEGWRLDDFLTSTKYEYDGVYVRDLIHDVIKMQAFGTYDDSDPFDYRDINIRDKEGNKANYGDVVSAMATILDVPVSEQVQGIVSAGWNVSDSTARRAAEKMKRLGAKISISVHFYGAQARNDPERYRESLKMVIRTLHPHIKFRIYGKKEIALIQGLYSELGISEKPKFSRFTFEAVAVGRAKQFGTKERSHQFIQGYFILPNGDIVWSHEWTGQLTHTGYNIFSKTKNIELESKIVRPDQRQ